MSSQDVPREYQTLLRIGFADVLTDLADEPSPADLAWCEEMERLASVDDLTVKRYFNWVLSGGNFTAVGVMLLNPDGTDFPHRWTIHGSPEWADEAWESLSDGWGFRLHVARLRLSLTDKLLNRDYRILRRKGCLPAVHLAYLETSPDDVIDLWRRHVAEPWFEGLKARAGRDGVEISFSRGGDSMYSSMGIEYGFPICRVA